MTYYLAIDYKSFYRPTWRFLKLIKMYSGSEEIDLRHARNYAITLMKKHNEIYCINILKRLKKNTYEGIERVYPDGITSVDSIKDGWSFIIDADIEEHKCYVDDIEDAVDCSGSDVYVPSNKNREIRSYAGL